MPDSIPAVGAEIKPPNTLGAFSNILGIKQQMLGIQQSQAGVQTAQATAQQAQQQNQEMMAAQSLAKAAQNGSFRKPDGSFDALKFSVAVSHLGPYAAQYANQTTSLANEMIANKTAVNTLNTQQQAEIGDTLTSIARNPKLTYSDVIDGLTEAASKNPQLTRMTLSVAGSFHPSMTTAQLQQGLKRVAMAMHTPATAAQGAQVQTSKGIQMEQVNPYNPGGMGPMGAPMPNALPPTLGSQPGTNAPEVFGPGNNAQLFPPASAASSMSQGASPSAQGSQQPGASQTQPDQSPPTNWNQPKAGQVQWLNQNTQAMVERAKAGIAAANTSPQALDALDRMRAILDQGTWTGTAFSGFKDLKNLAASIGMDTKTAQNSSELVKNMARFEAARAAAVGNTDASRMLVEEGSPNYHMDAKAVKSVVLQSMANERIIQTYGNLMETSPDPQTAMQREQQFRSIPHLLQMFELGEMRSQPEVQEFLKRYDISGATLAKSRQMYEQLMGNQVQQ